MIHSRIIKMKIFTFMAEKYQLHHVTDVCLSTLHIAMDQYNLSDVRCIKMP